MARRWVAASFASLGLLLVGCTAGANNGTTPSGEATGPVVTTALPAANGDIETLNWGLPGGEPPTLDPPNAASTTMALVATQLCEPVVRIKPDYSIEPYLVDFDQVDPLTLRLTLVADATFWDGSPVTVDDIVYSMNRTMNPDAILSYLYGSVKSITKTDAKTITVKFNEPDELFIKAIGGGAGMVVQKKFAEAAGDKFGKPGEQLMCSGPFKLQSWKVGQSITLERNENFWNDEYRAHAKTVNLRFISDSTTLAQALKTGEIDGAYEVPTALIPGLQGSQTGSVYFGGGPLSYGLSWANDKAPLSDPKLRQAIYIATDREALAQTVFQGSAQASYTLIFEGTWDYDAIDQWKEAEKPFRETNAFNLDKAKQLVAESAYKGQELVLTTQAGDETMSQVAQYIQQQAAAIGVTITINPVQPVDYATQGYDAEARKGTDILIGPSYNGYRDPMEGIGYTFEKDGEYNYTNYDNPEVNRLLAEARQTFDTPTRVSLLTQAQTIYEPDYPATTLLSTYVVSYLDSDLTGMITAFSYTRNPSLALIGAK